jgi:hypothetical protein
MRNEGKAARATWIGCRLRLATALGLAIGSSLAQAAPQDDLSFILHNRTGVDIKSLYAAPNQSGEWQDELLQGEKLLDGDDADITIPRGASVEKWDLKLMDRQGATLIWPAIDFSKTSEITLRLNLGKPYVELGDDN